jgi:hypothetical protein
VLLPAAQGVEGEMQAQKQRRRLLQDSAKRTPGTQFDTTIMQQTEDATAPCTQSIECDPSWAEQARGVVSIYAINTRIRAVGLCTGEGVPQSASSLCAISPRGGETYRRTSPDPNGVCIERSARVQVQIDWGALAPYMLPQERAEEQTTVILMYLTICLLECAGSIVNAPLGKRYLLTADHCFTDKNEISDFQYWLLIFNYEAPCANPVPPPFSQLLQVRHPSCAVLHAVLPELLPRSLQFVEAGWLV